MSKGTRNVLPALLVGAVVAAAAVSSAFKSHRAGGLRATVFRSPREFEDLAAEHFRRRGYEVRYVGGPGDGGVDLILRRRNRRYLVQAKRLRGHVNPDAVKAFCLTVKRQHAYGGFFVTTGRVSRAMRQLARSMRVQVIDAATIASYAGDRR